MEQKKKKSIKQIEGISNLSESLKLLEEINKIESATICSDEFHNKYEINLGNVNKGLDFNILHDPLIFEKDNWDYNNLEIRTPEIKIKVPYLYITKRSGNKVNGNIPSFEFRKFEKEKVCYHRLVLPISKGLNFICSVENVIKSYYCKSGIRTRDATEISIDETAFYLFKVSDKSERPTNNDYLVIESNTKMLYSDFSEYCFSILICFGYISGDFINDDGYFFQYNCQEMTDVSGLVYRQMRGSVKCKYVPIYSNPHGYIHSREIAELYIGKTRTLNLYEFSKLCQLCHSIADIKIALLFMIEVNTQTLIPGPGILSIVLETLANFIYEENETKLAPIKSKSTSKNFRNALLKVLKDFEDVIDAEGKEILKIKIAQINQRTNRDKLLAPFDILKIPITSMDIEAIDQRNAFLHGRTPMIKEYKQETIAEQDKLRYYLYLRLYVLISSILMKHTGYNGLVVNYPKIYENITGVCLDEEYYRQI